MANEPEIRDPNETIQFKIRIRDGLRSAFEESAARNNRTVNGEVVARLEESVRDDEQAGGAENAEVIRALGSVMRHLSNRFGVSWRDEPALWTIVADAALRLLSGLRPTGPTKAPPAVPRTGNVQAALERYQQEHDAWEKLSRERSLDVLRFMMKARSETPLTDQEKLDFAEAQKRVGEVPPEPQPDLPPDDLESWRNEAAWQQQIELGTQFAEAVVDAVIRDKSRR